MDQNIGDFSLTGNLAFSVILTASVRVPCTNTRFAVKDVYGVIPVPTALHSPHRLHPRYFLHN